MSDIDQQAVSDIDQPPGVAAKPRRRPRGSQAFWTIAVALPAAFSLLRLWIEAGGQEQLVLLLAANVSATNLLAALFVTGTRVVSMGLVVIFAIGGVLAVSAEAAEAAGRPLARQPLFARWTETAPMWLLTTTFVLAAATWPILYLPLLLPALVTSFQGTPPFRYYLSGARFLAVGTVTLGAYAVLVWPTLVEAWRQDEYFALTLLTLPPLLAVAVGGPLPAVLARATAATIQPTVVVLLIWAALPVISAPVLPLTVTTVTNPDESTRYVRGHVIGVDEDMTVILEDGGGVQYLDHDAIVARVLCPAPEELPVYRLRVRDFHVEDSLLEGIGRRVRPPATTDAACRATQPGGTSPAPVEPAP